jgi:hypothetical protein
VPRYNFKADAKRPNEILRVNNEMWTNKVAGDS